ncbi:MAG: ribbon-helix-helix domain-containing protein [Oscillospiraceae bacterium]|nr:ribbon-helix-helix domain-containing protein [Oscillospiraceae bacterium]
MSPKMGRPTNDPKNHDTRIRMSDEDVRILNECCKATGLTKSEVIRQGIREVYAKIKK